YKTICDCDDTGVTRMAVRDNWIGRTHCAVGLRGIDLDGNDILLRYAGKAVVRVEPLRPFTQRVPVVRAFVDDIDRFPGMQADDQRDQVIVCSVRRIEVPGEAMRIAQAVCP